MKKIKVLITLYLCFIGMTAFSQVSGVVFRDFNANGTNDASASYNEVGMPGVIVRGYNPAGVLLTTTYTGGGTSTNSTGAYSISGGTLGQVRVEFVMPNNAVFASNGVTGGATVMFPTGATQNLAVNYPDDYWDSATNPRIVVAAHNGGLITGSGSTFGAVQSSVYSSTGLNAAYQNENGATGTGPIANKDATIAQVGSIWGVAYNKLKKHAYFSTFLKRHASVASGLGYIYNYDYTNNASPVYSGKFNLQGVIPSNGGSAIDFGTVTRTGTNFTITTNGTPNVDLDGFLKVGKVSYGDIDMESGTNNLWAVNLFQAALIRIDVSGNPIAVPANVDQYILSSLPGYPTSSTGILRPWALEFNDGKGYLGVVNDASTGTDADLLAYVLRFDPQNINAGFTTVLTFDPNVKRGTMAAYEKFHRWIGAYSEPPVIIPGFDPNYRNWSQPILSDIEFDANGDMFLSVMDRFGHQAGVWNYLPLAGSTTTFRTNMTGDNLKACNTASGFVIEGGAGCGSATEFFADLSGDGIRENAEGSIALLKGKNQLIATVVDPNPNTGNVSNYWNTKGVQTYSLSTGLTSNWYSFFYSNVGSPDFGKAGGLGDVELLVDAAPIEIGNRVWDDTNSNGVQDAGEAGINGVVVDLYLGATKVGTTTTANGGQYYFKNSNVNLGGATGLLTNTAYIVRIAAANIPSGKTVTILNGVSTGLTGVADNDATMVSGNADISYTTGSAGQNNHSLDFGFVAACTSPSAITFTQVAPTCTGATANNNGTISLATATNGTHFGISTLNAASYDGPTTTATATALGALPMVIKSSVPNTGGTYRVRIFNGADACFTESNGDGNGGDL